MKPHLLALVLLLGLAPLSASDVPALKAADAATIAQGDLASRGLEATVYIAEVVYKKPGLLGGDPAYWEILWSKEFDAQTPGRKEFGLKVKMDGTFTRSVR